QNLVRAWILHDAETPEHPEWPVPGRARRVEGYASPAMAAFRQACGVVEGALGGSARRDLVGEHSLRRLRKALRSHALAPFVPEVDRRTRQDGFHVLHDWDGKADHVNPDIIPVDVLDYVVQRFGDEESYRASTIAILLDYYFLHVLSLLSLRIWDEGDPDA